MAALEPIMRCPRFGGWTLCACVWRSRVPSAVEHGSARLDAGSTGEVETDATSFDTATRPGARRHAVLYARVSSKDQERGGFSIPAQRQLLRAYARERGFEIVEAFTEVETAGKAGRTGFGAMLRYLRRHPKCRAILVEKTDRLYRNIKDWVALDELDPQIHLVKEGVVLSDESRSSEQFVHGMKVLVAKHFVDNLREETKKGLLEKARQGLWPSRAPIGYVNAVRWDGKHVIEPDAERAPLIAKLFNWYAIGDSSLSAVTSKALQAGLTYAKSGKPLARSAIHRVLQNPIYMGEFDWNGVRYRGTHKPIVSRDMWNDVQAVLTGRAPTRRRGRQSRAHRFAGLVACGACAADGKRFMLVGEGHKQRYVYYRCEGCKKLGRAVYVREQAIADAYIQALEQLELPAPTASFVGAAMRGDATDKSDDAARDLDRLRAERDDITARIDMAYEDRLAGRIGGDYFEERARQWRARLEELDGEIARREAAAIANSNHGPSKLELPQPVDLFRDAPDAPSKRRLIKILHSNSSWRAGTLTVKWRQPAEILEELMEAR